MKNFDVWNVQKKDLDSLKRDILFKEGEIWWCALGINIGREVYGKGKNFRRPVIIFKKLSLDTCIALPMTTVEQKGSWFHRMKIFEEYQWVTMNQIRLISTNRLHKKLTRISQEQFQELKKSVALLLGLSEHSHRA